jgi:hypothetical protein
LRRSSSYPLGVSESPTQIRKHIEILSTFEQRYGEFLAALREEWEGEGKRWTDEETARRKREIQMLATRADLAMKASGVGQILILHPPAAGGGLKSGDLPSQVFDFDGFAFGTDGMEIQQQILNRIPSQIAGLEVRLEEAEAAEKEAGMRQFGEVFEQSRQRSQAAQERREGRAEEASGRQPAREAPDHRPWWENPWIVGIGVTVIGGGILALIVALVSG